MSKPSNRLLIQHSVISPPLDHSIHLTQVLKHLQQSYTNLYCLLVSCSHALSNHLCK